MATYNILTAHTGTMTQQMLATGDSLYLAKSGTLNSLGKDGAHSTGGNNDLQIHGTLAGGQSAFLGDLGGDLIQIYAGATVLGGVVSAITVDGTGDNTFQNAGSVSTHTTSTDVAVIDLEGDNNHVTNTGSITANQNGTGVLLDGASNTFNNSGTITAGTDGHNFASGAGVFINDGGASPTDLQSIVNSGSITALNGIGVWVDDGDNNLSNTSSGVISGSESGVALSDGSNTVTNAGSITGGVGVAVGLSQTGLYIDGGNNTVHNSGSISGNYGLRIDGGSNNVTNTTSGHITNTSEYAVYLNGNEDNLHNDGHIVSVGEYGVYMDGDDNTLFNGSHGRIVAQGTYADAVFMDSGTNTITNNGHITGNGYYEAWGVYIDGSDNDIVNQHGGVIQAIVSNAAATSVDSYAVFAYGDNHLTNDGSITVTADSAAAYETVAVYFDEGDNSIVNQHHGVISDTGSGDNWAIYMAGGTNTVTNKGHITGTVVLGVDGVSDSFNGANGHFNGTIYGGGGNDAIEVGKGVSTIFGGDGADFLQAGSGHNTFDYTTVDNSFGSGADHFDTVDDFNAAKDMLNFSFSGGVFDSADFATVGGAALTESNFDADIKADVGNHLHANSAVLLQISGGEFAGDSFLIVDGNGQAGYQHGSDYVVELTNISGSFSAADIGALI